MNSQVTPPRPPAPAVEPTPTQPIRPAQLTQQTQSDHQAPTTQSTQPIKTSSDDSVSWQISHTPHQRGTVWYVIAIVVLLALAIVAFLLHWFFQFWQLWSTAGLGILIIITLIVVNRPTAQPTGYTVSTKGIRIGNQELAWELFRAFCLSNNGNNWIMTLIPTKRLMAGEPIPIPPDKGEVIIDLVGSHLPMEQPSRNILNTIMERLKI